MDPALARRALRLLTKILDGTGPGTERGCKECHCADCLKEIPHRCAITRLLDELEEEGRHAATR